LARAAGHERPLMIAVDQEGGRVQRMREPWTRWPPLRALGRTDSEDLARRMGEALAHELKACGVRWDFAPVVDVDTNPDNPVIGDRSFGDDPGQVGRLATAMIAGLQRGGLAACAKHFPGHGDTDVDSHLELPAVDHSLSRLEEIELPPFRAAIEAGVASVMTSHVLVRELDDERPATLSPRLVSGLLREELGFGGVVATDDMDMKAVAKRWQPGEAAVLAAGAGCDVLCYCADHDAQVEAVEALVRAVESGRLSWKAMEAAVIRVRALKDRYLLPWRDPDPREARLAAGGGERAALAEEIETRSGLRA
jgi:beta-N-acetylhexosaminidase